MLGVRGTGEERGGENLRGAGGVCEGTQEEPVREYGGEFGEKVFERVRGEESWNEGESGGG